MSFHIFSFHGVFSHAIMVDLEGYFQTFPFHSAFSHITMVKAYPQTRTYALYRERQLK